MTDTLLAGLGGLLSGWLIGRYGGYLRQVGRWIFRRPLPVYIVREEPTNIVRYAGKDLAAAKAAYHGTPVAAGMSLNFYIYGKNRGIRHAFARSVRGTGERIA